MTTVHIGVGSHFAISAYGSQGETPEMRPDPDVDNYVAALLDVRANEQGAQPRSDPVLLCGATRGVVERNIPR